MVRTTHASFRMLSASGDWLLMLLESIRRLSSQLRERNPNVGMPGYARRLSPPPPAPHLWKTLHIARDVAPQSCSNIFLRILERSLSHTPQDPASLARISYQIPNYQVRFPQITSILRELITPTCHLETERLLHSAWTSTSYMQRHHPSRVLRKDPTRLFQSWSKSHF